jgi:hypothetical protein
MRQNDGRNHASPSSIVLRVTPQCSIVCRIDTPVDRSVDIGNTLYNWFASDADLGCYRPHDDYIAAVLRSHLGRRLSTPAARRLDCAIITDTHARACGGGIHVRRLAGSAAGHFMVQPITAGRSDMDGNVSAAYEGHVAFRID